jgi:hypothetical protein
VAVRNGLKYGAFRHGVGPFPKSHVQERDGSQQIELKTEAYV